MGDEDVLKEAADALSDSTDWKDIYSVSTQWADDTLVHSDKAFETLKFSRQQSRTVSGKAETGWPVKFKDRQEYLNSMRDTKRQQVG